MFRLIFFYSYQKFGNTATTFFSGFGKWLRQIVLNIPPTFKGLNMFEPKKLKVQRSFFCFFAILAKSTRFSRLKVHSHKNLLEN